VIFFRSCEFFCESGYICREACGSVVLNIAVAVAPWVILVPSKKQAFRGGRSHFFRLILNPSSDPGPAIFQIWESDSCSDSGYSHQSHPNSAMFLLKKLPHRLLLLPKLKNDSVPGPVFHKFFTPGPAPVRKKNAEPFQSRHRIRFHLCKQ